AGGRDRRRDPDPRRPGRGTVLMPLPLPYFLVLGGLMFAIGAWGVLTRTNAIRVLMSVELMLNAVNINLVAFNRYLTPSELPGQVFAIFGITIAAAEAALGLAIVLMITRRRGTVDINKVNTLRG